MISIPAQLYYVRSIVSLLTSFRRPSKMLKAFLGRQAFADRKQPLVVELQNPRVQFFVRSRMEIWSVKEVFVDRFYTRFGYAVEPGWTVVDIGRPLANFRFLQRWYQ